MPANENEKGMVKTKSELKIFAHELKKKYIDQVKCGDRYTLIIVFTLSGLSHPLLYTTNACMICHMIRYDRRCLRR